jgi:hypothetical protein
MALIKEADLLDPIARYARRRGYTRQFAELPFYDYRIDLYGVAAVSGQTVAIELKLYKWKRALQQALVYQLCADLVYLAVPEGTLRRIDNDLIAEHGIGLIAVGPRGCRLRLQARQSQEVREYYKKYYVELLKEGRNCQT